jgi:transglutaminase-like putative cysteine protease
MGDINIPLFSASRRRFKSPKTLLLTAVMLLCSLPVFAKTLMLEGMLDGRIAVKQQMSFSVAGPMNKLFFRFALPTQFSNRAVNQEIEGLQTKFYPEPTTVRDDNDKFGNRFRTVTWNGLNSDARVTIEFQAHVRSGISAMESAVPFPLRPVGPEEGYYLKATGMVQSDNPEIAALSKKLTSSAKTEYEAVSAILTYVGDNVKYNYNPPDFDALYTLKTGSGNCQNFARVSMSLLRAAGIPARIVGGISLKEPWKIPVGHNNYLVESMGQGGHAWMEIYFPDLGWLSYDPQQSKQFTSTRHIKQSHGLDSTDINDSWSGSPYLPEYSESIDAKFLEDKVALNLKSSLKAPKNYMLSNILLAKSAPETNKPQPEALPEVVQQSAPDALLSKPIVLPQPPQEALDAPQSTTLPVPVKPKPQLPKGKTVEFGNMEFPNLVDMYRIEGNKGVRILDKETAEYVTSRYIYAQAFEVDSAIEVMGISLAMHKFGGDGSVYLDLTADDNGRPNILAGIRSMPIPLEKIRRMPGYYWVDFVFPEGAPSSIAKGRYWIVLRRSGEAVMNWFYIPGNPYGEVDDTRSTLKGYKWEDIQNYDFVFKVRGKVL